MDKFNISSLFEGKDAFIDSIHNRFARLSSGFKNIDICLQGGLNPELYTMTAETSVGKSAFMSSIAENRAAAGNNVLYFSFEMGEEEFNARGISKESFKAHLLEPEKHAYTAGDILYRKYDETIRDFTDLPYLKYERYAESFFSKCGKNFYIVECAMDRISANDIKDLTIDFKEKHPDKPLVVFVDYLQLIAADEGDSSQRDRKTKVDVAVKTLKGLSNLLKIPVFTVSSVPRSEYGKPQALGTAKESGDTDYTAGIMIGWDWVGVTDAKNKEAADKEKAECKRRGYRKMRFSVLKFRNSERDTSAILYYFPAYNFFTELDPEHYSPAELVPTNNPQTIPVPESEEDEWPDFPDNAIHV